ncbi:MAG TPA: hypothetical protein VFR15_00250 [Chloroflexia bacterium]|nr:hypothetical protein [Chloroflexia bacterium]
MTTTSRQPQRKTKRGAAGKQDLRLLVAAASVAVTLGGAGMMAAQEPAAALPAQPQVTATPPTQAAATAGTTGQAPIAAEPAATPVPVDLPVVTIPQRQWPGPMASTRSSR